MKLVYEPTVYLVGRQQVDEGALGEFLADHGVSGWATDTEVGGEKLCEVAGRLCYMSFARPRPGGNAAYLGHLLGVGHTSVLEHAAWNFVVTGLSRSLSHELVRHRVGVSPSQLSQRYVDESVAEYVVPPDLRAEVEAHGLRSRPGFVEPAGGPGDAFRARADAGRRWVEAVAAAHESYVALSAYLAEKARAERPDLSGTDARKFARQAARSVLPNATETKIFLTFNARALLWFLELRGSRHADPEIRKLAAALLLLMLGEAPNVFGHLSLSPLPDGTFEVTK